jgi:hypothetical protein
MQIEYADRVMYMQKGYIGRLRAIMVGVYFAIHRRLRQGFSSSGPYQLVSHKDENEGDEEILTKDGKGE